MPAARTKQGLDPARAADWRVLLSALAERARAAGGYPPRTRLPRLFASGFPAAAYGFLSALAAAIRGVSALYFDDGDFDRANADHPPQRADAGSDNPWRGVRCPVAGPPGPGLALGSKAMARFMERCADAIGAMRCVRIGDRACYAEAVQDAPYSDTYHYRIVGGDGEPAPVAAPLPGEVRAFAVPGRALGEFHALGTGLRENGWTRLGAVSEPGGFLLFPHSPVDPDSAGPGWRYFPGFRAHLFLFPSFTPIQPSEH